MVTMVLVNKAELYGWHSSTTVSVAGIAVNALIGGGLIVVFMRFLRELDELNRKIQMDTLALVLRLVLVGGVNYSLLETAKPPTSRLPTSPWSNCTLIWPV